MTKEALMQENQELKNRIANLEKENSEFAISSDCAKLWEIRGLYERQIDFYQNLLMNLTRNKEGNNEQSNIEW